MATFLRPTRRRPLDRGGGRGACAPIWLAHAEERYVDECHMCFEMRRALRNRFTEVGVGQGGRDIWVKVLL